MKILSQTKQFSKDVKRMQPKGLGQAPVCVIRRMDRSLRVARTLPLKPDGVNAIGLRERVRGDPRTHHRDLAGDEDRENGLPMCCICDTFYP